MLVIGADIERQSWQLKTRHSTRAVGNEGPHHKAKASGVVG